MSDPAPLDPAPLDPAPLDEAALALIGLEQVVLRLFEAVERLDSKLDRLMPIATLLEQLGASEDVPGGMSPLALYRMLRGS